MNPTTTRTKTITVVRPIKVKNGKTAKCARSWGDKKFCIWWNQGKCINKKCDFVHGCNILESNEKVCCGKHKGCDHTTKFVPSS